MTEALGVRYGTEPEQFRHSKLIIAWGANVLGTNVHLWPFIVEARRNGARFYTIDPRRNRTGDAADKRGTEVSFLPSQQTFTMTEFDFATLEHRLRELAFLNSGVTIVLSDMRHAVEKRDEMRYEGGVEELVKYLDRTKNSRSQTRNRT